MISDYHGDELPDKLRDTTAKLLIVVCDVHLDADGLPCDRTQEFELWSATSWAHHLVAVLRSPVGTPAGEVRRVADEYVTLVIATKGAHRSAAIGRRWLALRDRAVELFGELFGPTEVDVPDAVPADAIESLRDDNADPDGPPRARLDPEDEVSPGEDIVTVEGGYKWHTDGRAPEPVD